MSLVLVCLLEIMLTHAGFESFIKARNGRVRLNGLALSVKFPKRLSAVGGGGLLNLDVVLVLVGWNHMFPCHQDGF